MSSSSSVKAVFAYIYDGSVRFGDDDQFVPADPGRVVLFGDGEVLAASAGPEGARFLLAAGRPLRDPSPGAAPSS